MGLRCLVLGFTSLFDVYGVLHACMSMYHVWTEESIRSGNGANMVVSCHVGAEIKAGSSGRAATILNY